MEGSEMSDKRLCSLLVSLVLVGAGCGSNRSPAGDPEPVGSSTSAFSAAWTDVVGVTTVANSLTKTAADGWGDAAAASTQTLSGDGYVQFTTGENTTYKMAGLTHAVADAGYTTIDFAFYLLAGGGIEIWEGGQPINGGQVFGTYAAGDIFKVQFTGGTTVTYLQNGNQLYASAQAPSSPLMFDTSLYSQGATINNVNVVSTPFWQNVVGVTTSGHTLTKIAAAGWNAGASTIASLSGNGFAEFEPGDTTTYKMAGLTHAVADSGYATIDYAIFPLPGGTYEIWEDGVAANGGASFGSYAATDVFRVAVTNNVVTYLQNGMVVYTSTKAPTFPLVFDASLYSQGATLVGVNFPGTPFWVDTAGVTVNGTGLTKTAPDGWDAGGSTVASLNGDGYFEFTATSNNAYLMAGPTHAVADNSYTTIDYAVYPLVGGILYIYEKGALVFQTGTYAAGDVFRVQVSNNVVTYLQNGVLIYTSTLAPTFPLVFDASLYSQGAGVSNVTLVPVPAWQDASGVSIAGANLTKTGAAGWNAGAALVQTLTGDGFCEFSSGETSTYKLAGLTHAVTDNGYATIDFGVFLDSAGGVSIFESGVEVANPGTYAAGDVFRVAANSGVVTYLKNGSLLYTSKQSASPTLLFDASLYSKGATVNGVTLTASSSFWHNTTGVSFSGTSNMTKTSSDGWDAGGSSIGSLSGDGSFTFFTGSTATYMMLGLTHTVTDSGFATIDFGLFVATNGSVSVFEDGVEVAGSLATIIPGDGLTVQVSGGVVSYLKDGITLYTSTKTPTFPLVADASLYTKGATVVNPTLSP
jgi:hypothetical protein